MFLRILIFAFLTMTLSTFAQTPPVEPGVPRELARWRAANYSDVRYKLDITLEKGAPLMKGDLEIRVNLTEEGAKNDLILDWRTTQFAGDKDKPFANVVAVNDAPDILASESKEHLIIPHPLLKTGENLIKIQFASPIKTSGAAVTRYVDKEDGGEYIYSLFVPSDASTAFPVFDQPDLKARFQLRMMAPIDWKVVTNTDTKLFTIYDGVFPRGSRPTSRFFDFKETKPISTYVFAFAAGDFVEVKENPKSEIRSPKSIYVRRSQAERFKPHAAEVFRLNREAVKYFEDYFDYKFPFPKYDLVLIPEFPFGGMEHAGATFLRETSVIFPTEPTANNYISRASVIFHEAAHQWFGDTVTMRWFDDLWLKEGFATFMAYKAMEKIMPEYDAWKVFYERTKQSAYRTDVTQGTTPIYQEIANLSAAKSAYGNIVYQKAPSFLKQAEFYLGEKEFQTAVRAFLKKHQFANATWQDLVGEFEAAGEKDLKIWANIWVKKRGLPVIRLKKSSYHEYQELGKPHDTASIYSLEQDDVLEENGVWLMKTKVFLKFANGETEIKEVDLERPESDPKTGFARYWIDIQGNPNFKPNEPVFVFPNYQDFGYGIFLPDEKSREYVLQNIQNEKDPFLRSMMWGSLWDSVRFAELDPRRYVELVVKNIDVESDDVAIATLLGRVSTAMTYYLSVPSAAADGSGAVKKNPSADGKSEANPSATAEGSDLSARLEKLLIEKMQNAPTLGQRITFYRSFLNIASSEKARNILKNILGGKLKIQNLELKTKDKFDIVTRLIVLGDADGLKLLAELEKTETDDAARRYAYAARAGIPSKENKAKYWKDFTENKEISESWIEEGFGVFNSPRQSDLTLTYLEKALAELPNLKRNRKIFFVNGWLGEFIGGQKSAEALKIVNRFLEENPGLDRDLRLKILENVDSLERAVKIRSTF
ncbi:MAG: M1 family aminopeptidase [Pyrinomonadaceae bacterium]